MALIDTFEYNVKANNGRDWYKMKVEVHLNSQSIANNTSNITLKQFFATRVATAGWYTISHTMLKTELSVGGASYETKIPDTNMKDMPQNAANVWRQFGSWTGNVAHDAEGKQNIRVRISVSRNNTTQYLPQNTTGTSGSIALPTIPRASTLNSFSIESALKPNTDNKVLLSITRASSSFTHDITLLDGSTTIASWTGQGVPTSLTITAAQVNALLGRMANVVSKTLTLRVQTKSGSTNIGSALTRTATVTVDSSVKPIITNITDAIYGNGFDKNTIGGYVQNISRVTIGFTDVAVGGATIASRTIKIGSASAVSGSNVTSGVLTTSGQITITITVTDSRGRTTIDTSKMITVLAYSPPRVTAFGVVRKSDPTTQASITHAGTWSNLSNKNVLTVLIRQRPLGGGWVNLVNTTMTSGTLSGTITATGLSDTNSYEYEFRLTDSFGNTDVMYANIGTARVAFNIAKDRGIGVGKIWEESDGNALQVQGGGTIDGHQIATFASWEEW